MAFRESDIIFYKSGTNGNGLGGPMHTESISPFQLHNVFNLVSGVEKMIGKTKYRCVYMKNKSLTETAINPRVYIPEDTVSSTTTLFVGFDPNAGLGDGTSSGITSPIPNESTAPSGVRFTQASDPSQGIALGFNIPPKKAVAVWLKLVVFLNTESAPVDGCDVVFRFGNLLPQSGGAGTDVILAITGETDSLQPFSRLIERIKLRSFLSSVVFTGNVTTSQDPTTWLNMLGALRDRIGIAFGPHDNKNTTMKNQLITEINNTNNVKSSGYSYQIINNTYIIYLDVTQTFTNPSPQFDFIKEQLAQAKVIAGIDFIIVVCNKAFYATLAPNDISMRIDNSLRATYHQLFVDNGVHLVISGQTRNYQRHHILGYNSATPDSPTVFFANQNSGYMIAQGQKNFGATGCLFINIGTGGMRPLHTLTDPKKYYTLYANGLQNQESVGYLMLKCTKRTATRGPTMLGLFFEYYTPAGSTTPIETQRDVFAITILTSGTNQSSTPTESFLSPIIPTTFSQPQGANYGGGPLYSSPAVYVIFDGAEWNTITNPVSKQQIIDKLNIIQNSTYYDALLQYNVRKPRSITYVTKTTNNLPSSYDVSHARDFVLDAISSGLVPNQQPISQKNIYCVIAGPNKTYSTNSAAAGFHHLTMQNNDLNTQLNFCVANWFTDPLNVIPRTLHSEIIECMTDPFWFDSTKRGWTVDRNIVTGNYTDDELCDPGEPFNDRFIDGANIRPYWSNHDNNVVPPPNSPTWVTCPSGYNYDVSTQMCKKTI